MKTLDLTAIEVPQDNLQFPIPLLMRFAEAANHEGLRFKGQTYDGSTGASSGETGDFSND